MPVAPASLAIRHAEVLVELFDGLPNVMFCVKDCEGRYVRVNQAFADRSGRATPAAVVGLRACDLFPPELAASYEAQDRQVLVTGRSVRNQLELILRPDGSPGWFVTNKVVLRDERGRAAGIAAVSLDLQAAPSGGVSLDRVATVIEVIRTRYAEPLTVAELATVAGMTPLQLERRMRRYLGMAVKQLLLRTRLEHAAALLRSTDLVIAEVAARCGYYDQSSLSRQFKRILGYTPGEYRARFGPPSS
ncbi:MAG: AraC family transcriptional regulator [Actinobacteria bacterium]|nr:AraC family transcriptional regulator [Actinomycetota bacterium]